MKQLQLFFITMVAMLLISSTIDSQNLTQTLKGSVFDSESQSPIEGAIVLITNSLPVLKTITNKDGSFKIEKVPVGRYNIIVSFIGYETNNIPEILITSGKEVVMNIPLKQSSIMMKEVSVKAFSRKDRPTNSMAMISARAFTVEETRRYAGGLDDPARLASAFAGVTVGNVQDNAIIIRGNSPKGLAWRLEDIDIPNPNHFAGGHIIGGGAVTIFSSQMLGNSDFYTGAFPAEYGNATAGVFDMKLRSGNNEKHEHTFQIGMMGIDFASEGPIGKKGGASYLFNYRYSTLGLLTKLNMINTDEDINYQDVSFKLNFPLKKAGTITLWGIGSADEDSQQELTDSLKWENEWDRVRSKWKLNMGAAGLSHKIIIGTNTVIKTTLAGSNVLNKMDCIELDNNLILKPYRNVSDESSKITLSSSLNTKLRPGITFKTGFTTNFLSYNLKLSNLIANDLASYQEIVNESGNSSYMQLFASSKIDINSSLSLTGGLHALYFGLNKRYSVDPRFSVRWAFSERQSVSVGYGRHSQLEELRLYFIKQDINGTITYPNKDLDIAKAHHFVMAYDWRINDDLRLKVEPYFQYLYDVPGIRNSSYSLINFSQDWKLHDKLENLTIGRNYGVDITIEHFLKDNFYYLITSSIFESKYRGDDKVWRNTRYNKNFTINLLAGKEFYTHKKNVWGVNGRVNYLGGEHYDPIKLEESIISKSVITDPSRAFEMQYPSKAYVDLTITYRINKPKYSSTFAFQLKNALGTLNDIEPKYNYKTKTLEEDKIKVIMPVASYKIDF